MLSEICRCMKMKHQLKASYERSAWKYAPLKPNQRKQLLHDSVVTCSDLCYVGHLLNQVSYIQSLFFLRQMNFKAFLSR